MLCAGQVYYHLSAARRARRIRDIVLVRLEQIAPFPSDLMFKARMRSTRPCATRLDLPCPAGQLCTALLSVLP